MNLSGLYNPTGQYPLPSSYGVSYGVPAPLQYLQMQASSVMDTINSLNAGLRSRVDAEDAAAGAEDAAAGAEEEFDSGSINIYPYDPINDGWSDDKFDETDEDDADSRLDDSFDKTGEDDIDRRVGTKRFVPRDVETETEPHYARTKRKKERFGYSVSVKSSILPDKRRIFSATKTAISRERQKIIYIYFLLKQVLNEIHEEDGNVVALCSRLAKKIVRAAIVLKVKFRQTLYSKKMKKLMCGALLLQEATRHYPRTLEPITLNLIEAVEKLSTVVGVELPTVSEDVVMTYEAIADQEEELYSD